MGVNWAGTLIGCICILLTPMPFLFYRYGARIRGSSKFAPCIVSLYHLCLIGGRVLMLAQDLKIAKQLAAEREAEKEKVREDV